jgi:hypothetical protein
MRVPSPAARITARQRRRGVFIACACVTLESPLSGFD